MFSQQPRSVKCSGVNTPTITSKHPDYESNPACIVDPSKTGEFEFKGIPSGKYIIRPYIQNKNVQLHIQPEFIEFEVLKDTLIISNEFSVTGFNAVGRVLGTPNGIGVANAKIIVNGEQLAVTHTDGSYVLKNIKADTYAIHAAADDVQFTKTNVKVTLGNPLPDIIVTAFKVCGQVLSQRSFTVAISKPSSTFHIQAVSQAGSGEWCSYLPSGRYIVEVLTNDDDKSQGVQ